MTEREPLRRLLQRLELTGALRTSAMEEALWRYPRQAFLPPSLQREGFRDRPLLLRDEKGEVYATALAPSESVRALEVLEVERGDEALLLGAGSGWEAALLSHLVGPRGRVVVVDPTPAGRYALSRWKALKVPVTLLRRWPRRPVQKAWVQVPLWTFPWRQKAWAQGARLLMPLHFFSPLQGVYALWERGSRTWKTRAFIDGMGDMAALRSWGRADHFEIKPGARVHAAAFPLTEQAKAWHLMRRPSWEGCPLLLRGRVTPPQWRGLFFWLLLHFPGEAAVEWPGPWVGWMNASGDGELLHPFGAMKVLGKATGERLRQTIGRWVAAGKPPLERFRLTVPADGCHQRMEVKVALWRPPHLGEGVPFDR